MVVHDGNVNSNKRHHDNDESTDDNEQQATYGSTNLLEKHDQLLKNASIVLCDQNLLEADNRQETWLLVGTLTESLK